MLINFLHTYNPQSILITFGPITVYWYGFFMALALLLGLLISVKIAKWHGVKKEVIYDLFFWLIIGGFLGARIFYILYNFNYFWQNPFDIFKIWQGGIAIHGALVFGFLILLWFSKKSKINFWRLTSIIVPGVALGQAIGRWGNYFNQELFGLPTDLSWGIPIALANRPAGYEMFEYFQPTFLYESLGNFFIFCLLLMFHWFLTHNTHNVKRITHNTLRLQKLYGMRYELCVMSYAFLYSILRFFIEFLRIDPTAGNIFGMRATQGLSLIIIIAVVGYLVYDKSKKK